MGEQDNVIRRVESIGVAEEARIWLTDVRDSIERVWWNAMNRHGFPPNRERSRMLVDQLLRLLERPEQEPRLSPQFGEGDWVETAGIDEVLTHLTCMRYAVLEQLARSNLPAPLDVLQVIDPIIDQWMTGLSRDALHSLNCDLSQQLAEWTSAAREAMSRLAKLEKTKSDFISIAAHELKTPLTLIKGYTAILTESSQERDQGELVSLASGIIRGTERLGELIGDMIDVAAIDSESLGLRRDVVFLSKLVELAIAEVRSAAPERQVEISVNDLSKLPEIEGDAQRLYQVLTRVIGNGVKYTPERGGVDISSRLLYSGEMDSGDQFIELIVADTGIGIDPDDQEWVFEKFYCVADPSLHSTSKARFKGAGPGLGLTIARGIVEAHGGLMWVESEGYDEERCPGSQFHIVLPTRFGGSADQTRHLVREKLLQEVKEE